jgi:hypothetical protein
VCEIDYLRLDDFVSRLIVRVSMFIFCFVNIKTRPWKLSRTNPIKPRATQRDLCHYFIRNIDVAEVTQEKLRTKHHEVDFDPRCYTHYSFGRLNKWLEMLSCPIRVIQAARNAFSLF